MKRTIETVLTGVAVMLLLLGCARTGGQSSPDEYEDDEEVEMEAEEDSLSDDDDLLHGKSLNDIRFANFKKKDWLDNEYIRTLRRYLDDFLNGTIEDEELEQYRDEMKGQFAVYLAMPFMGGGMYLQIIFIDNPDYIFWAHVYSDVDIEEERVMGYHVNAIFLEEENSGITREEILKEVAERPEFKLW